MKTKLKQSLCSKIGLDSSKTLLCRATFHGDLISMLTVKDGIKTINIMMGTQEFNIAKSLFGVTERIRTPNYTYKIEE